MSAGKHTPGPWVVDDEAQIIAGNNVIASVEARPFYPENAWDWDRAFANAFLIAAAPDLLGALEDAAVELEICAWEDGVLVNPRAEDAAKAVRAAIAKATGAA